MKTELWHGAHNNFVVMYYEKDVPRLKKCKIQEMNRYYNTDGLIQITIKKNIVMRFFNPDGSLDNCGNGLRVTASFCFKNNLCKDKGVIESLGLKFPFLIKKEVPKIFFNNFKKKDGLWSIGNVVHKTIIVENFEKSKKVAKSIRNKLDCNVTIIKKLDKGIFAQTFERGVENFTAACGTGAIAASLQTRKNKVFMPGGLLEISKRKGSIALSGPTKMVGLIENEI
ncbi:hypothetical protein HY500_04235 [Candidatus Woesearchaeota archaeon]|nr:hypothetical protein [Candidatus Woesearchaeota archaeon]MBI4159434.1 hypothetical protein [Candidatus Woesearchaeota archaeon]